MSSLDDITSVAEETGSHESREVQFKFDNISTQSGDDAEYVASMGIISNMDDQSLHVSSQEDDALPTKPSRTIPTRRSTQRYDQMKDKRAIEKAMKYFIPHAKMLSFGKALASSLDQSVAANLTLHLYNAFHLKSLKRGSEKRPPKEPRDLHVLENRLVWIPRKVWTAWPLPPETAPRDDKLKAWSENSQLPDPYIYVPPRPGEDMQDILTAQALRFSSSQFRMRPWQNQEFSSPGKITQKLGIKSEQDRDRQSAGGNISFTAGEDDAAEQLRPSIQNVLYQLDKIFMAMYQARRSYLSLDTPKYRKALESRGRSVSRKRQRRAHGKDVDSSDPEYESGQPSEGSSQDQRYESLKKKADSSSARSIREKFLRRKQSLGLHSWSDVLGIAAMCGVEAQCIDNALRRCSSLFKETMDFRILQEGTSSLLQASIAGKRSPSTSINNSESDQFYGGVHIDGFLQPIK